MGLDILVLTDNLHELHTPEYFEPANEYFQKHSLSRTFCNLMCRQDVVTGETELDQIGRIAKVDVTPIYEMNGYGSENGEELEFFLESAETEDERSAILQQAKANKEKLSGNLENVLNTVDTLIKRLAAVENLPALLDDNGYDTLDNDVYFSNFNRDKGNGYMDNNFGQDLRNFRRFLEYAKEKGAKTVYFNYG